MTESFTGKEGSPQRPVLTPRQAERFKAVVWPCLPMVLRSARYLTRDDHNAEDLAQETLMKAMRAIDSFADGTNVKAWLLTILRRTHIDRGRAARNRGHAVGVEQVADIPAAEDHLPTPGELDHRWSDPERLLDEFEDQDVVNALRDLPEDIRWTLLLLDIEQLDQATVSELLEVPVGTVKSRAYRGRGMLRDQLFRLASSRGWIEESTPESANTDG